MRKSAKVKIEEYLRRKAEDLRKANDRHPEEYYEYNPDYQPKVPDDK